MQARGRCPLPGDLSHCCFAIKRGAGQPGKMPLRPYGPSKALRSNVNASAVSRSTKPEIFMSLPLSVLSEWSP